MLRRSRGQYPPRLESRPRTASIETHEMYIVFNIFKKFDSSSQFEQYSHSNICLLCHVQSPPLALCPYRASKLRLTHPFPSLMRANPVANIATYVIHHQDPRVVRVVVPTKRHTSTIPTAMTIQIARARDERTPSNTDVAPPHRSLDGHADAAWRMAGDILAVGIYGGGIEGSALNDGTGAVGEGLVEFVHEVVVLAEAAVV